MTLPLRHSTILATLLLAQAAMSAPLFAQSASPIYMCTDEDGHRIATNVPGERKKGYKCVRQFDTLAPSAPASQGATKGGGSQATRPSPADFPRVGADTQKARDDVRHKVLLEELGSEQKLLDKANQDLSDARTLKKGEEKSSSPYLSRVNDAEKAVQRHRANVESLQREIGKLK
jgi:hypothetical protein